MNYIIFILTWTQSGKFDNYNYVLFLNLFLIKSDDIAP